MGLWDRFRKAGDGGGDAFWERPPIHDRDVDVLYQYGLLAVGRSDGPAMMQTGWALWRAGGLHERQAFDFLSDGYSAWSGSPAFDGVAARRFQESMLGRLAAQPQLNGDVWQLPPEVVTPVAAHYGARCWAASELIELGVDSEQERQAFEEIASSPAAFVPPRSMGWARAYASNAGLPDPWP